MPERDHKKEEAGLLKGRSLSRREFLKIAGVASATVGLGASLGGALVACGEADETATTGVASTTATTAGSTTTVSVGPEAGRDIKVGVVAPMTGVLAAFAPPVDWGLGLWKETLAEGIVAGDGKTHRFVWLLRDTQSDSNRAAQVTGDLINNDKVDVVLSGGSPETVNPSADQCESQGVPSISSFVPWQGFVYARGGAPDKPFKWTYAHALGVDQLGQSFLDVWSHLDTNKRVGLVLTNNANGISLGDLKTGYPAMWTAAGYEVTFPALYQPGSEDFTAQITEFKKVGCEVCLISASTPDITNFWQQALQQGFHPKIMGTGLGLAYPQSAVALGEVIVGLLSELPWHPSWPFKDTLTGMTCQELANDYSAKTGELWSPAIGQYARMEWLVDALKRTGDVDDKEAIIKAIATTKMDTVLGPIDFTAPIKLGTIRPVENVYMPYLACGQWINGTGKDPYELIQVTNVWAPEAQVHDVVPMQYS